jgi:hypothetical protein
MLILLLLLLLLLLSRGSGLVSGHSVVFVPCRTRSHKGTPPQPRYHTDYSPRGQLPSSVAERLA